MNIGIQCSSFGQRCGISTYATRLSKYLNKIPDIKSKIFVEKYRNGLLDVMNVHYEPGMLPPQRLYQIIQSNTSPITVTAHHTMGLEGLYPLIDGIIIHDESQISHQNTKPWNYIIIPHPALVFPKKDKIEMRKKHNLPLDKKIIGTMGFICGTGKILPSTVYNLLTRMNDDEFLYLITPFWKGGDMNRYQEIMDVVKNTGKINSFRIETDFTASEEILNEKMQCCDLMYCWNNTTKNSPGSQSGSAADIYGARVKMIVKDVPHFSFIAKQDKVLTGRDNPDEFSQDVLSALRNENLEDIQNPDWLSWENMSHKYLEYFKEIAI